MALLFRNEKEPLPLSSKSENKTSMSWTKKTPKNKPHHKSPFTPKGFLSPKEPSWHDLSQRTTLKSTGTLAMLFPFVVGQTQRAKSLTMWVAGWHLTWHWAHPPTHALLRNTTLLLPFLLGTNAHGWHPFSTSSKRATRDNSTQRHDIVLAGHCRQLLVLSQFFFSGWDTDSINWEVCFVCHRVRVAETTRRSKTSILTLCFVWVSFFSPSSAETEAFDVAMFTVPKMRKVKEWGQLSTWEHCNWMSLTRNRFAKGQLSTGLSICGYWTWAPGQPEILIYCQFHHHSQKSESSNIFSKICS